HSDGNIFFRDISMLQGLAGAAPAAVAGAADLLDTVIAELRALTPEQLRAEMAKHKDSDIAVALRELEAPAALDVPRGWKLMPTKATSDMLFAMAECDGHKRGDRDHPGLTRWEDYWHMALAAAPQAPAAPSQGAEGWAIDTSAGREILVYKNCSVIEDADVRDERGGATIEFCTPGSGGGKSSRTRMALLAVMVAMEADNAADPGRDWWAERNHAAKAAAKGEHGNG
ncbi:MAG: hypothetical protein ACN6N5_14560, partial [Diaphorobacter nitroreducens]